jgi:hypothetical protein
VGVNVLVLLNVPLPVVAQAMVLKFVADAGVACVLKLKVVFRQTSWSLPAFTTGDGVMVNCMVLVPSAQLPLPVAVKVNVTVPVSAAPGV